MFGRKINNKLLKDKTVKGLQNHTN